MDQTLTHSLTSARSVHSSSTELVTGPWTLKDLKSGKVGAPKHGKTVFSCFHCGGGSTMGYKLAGYEVLGGVEIDPEMMSLYRENHNPRHSFFMGVQDFRKILDKDLPSELFDLDVLDGSPPCSSFSMSGSREDAWGKQKKFREGQTEQVLDDLFFDFIAIAKKLRPKVVVSENVKGMLAGAARGYVKMVFEQFEDAGYDTQLFLCNASRMGVPQARERVFFVSRRKDLNLPKVVLQFEEKEIILRDAFSGITHEHEHEKITDSSLAFYQKCTPGNSFSSVHAKGHRWNWSRESWSKPCRTMASTSASMILHPAEPRPFCRDELCRIQSFPDDYNFMNQKPGYVCGMSVPPLMMQRVASSVYSQLLVTKN